MCKPETEFLRLGRTIFKVIFPTKLTLILLSSICISAYSQVIQSEDLKTEIQEETPVNISLGKSIENISNNSITCLMTQSELLTLKNNSKQIIKSHINLTLGKPSDIKLNPNDFFENDFKCFTESNEGITQITIDKGTHFQGSINNEPNSSISMSIVGDQIQGLMYTSSDNQYLIHSESTVDQGIFIHFDKNLRNQTHAFECGTDDWLHYIDNKSDLKSRTKESCKRAKISVRADYDLYLKFNKNPQLVTNYITNLFNQINTIYRREEIQISLSEIIINITPDGFKHISSNLDLNYLKSNYKSFNGNIQICLSGFNNKGIANLGGVA
ncbi:MAG: hypothetical protein ABIO44_00100, partial [Saprospiraceae bacterium]